jgi:acetyl/propionyl-CoA carboxylase alpha subunit
MKKIVANRGEIAMSNEDCSENGNKTVAVYLQLIEMHLMLNLLMKLFDR